MANRFLIITFSFADEKNHTKDLKPVFDKALDWFRYMPNCWIVWTNQGPEKWYERLREKIADEDRLFIVELNIKERQGWLPTDFWDWLNEERKE